MLKDFKNNIDFYIRNKTKFSRKNFVEKNFDILERIEKENLYVKDVLEQFLEKHEKDNIQILDIGSKNWFYAKGEYSFFDTFCKKFNLDGIEIDAYRLYSNLYSRYEVAKFYTKGLKNTKYIADDLLNLNQKYDYIIWILPFVILSPLVMWGLPKRYFCPKKLLLHAYSLLNENGQMLIINQGEYEKTQQQNLLEGLEIPFNYIGEIKSNHFQYKNKRFGFYIRK